MSIESDNPLLNEVVEPEGELKDWLVNYVGEKVQPENEEVTVQMVITAVADEFPEFVMAVAEENWVRGYRQALQDETSARNLLDKENNETENNSNDTGVTSEGDNE